MFCVNWLSCWMLLWQVLKSYKQVSSWCFVFEDCLTTPRTSPSRQVKPWISRTNSDGIEWITTVFPMFEVHAFFHECAKNMSIYAVMYISDPKIGLETCGWLVWLGRILHISLVFRFRGITFQACYSYLYRFFTHLPWWFAESKAQPCYCRACDFFHHYSHLFSPCYKGGRELQKRQEETYESSYVSYIMIYVYKSLGDQSLSCTSVLRWYWSLSRYCFESNSLPNSLNTRRTISTVHPLIHHFISTKTKNSQNKWHRLTLHSRSSSVI